MKKILFIALLICPVISFSQVNRDSLFNIVYNTGYSDSLRLNAWEHLTKSFIDDYPDSCRKLCYEGLAFAQKVHDTRFEWSFYNRIGITYYYGLNYEKAVEFWLTALRVAESAKDTFALSQNINNLAWMYDDLHKPEKAINFYKQAIKLKRYQNREYLSSLKTPLYYKAKEKAERNLRKNTLGIGMQASRIASIFGTLKQFDSTEVYLKQAIAQVDKIEGNDDKYKLLVNIGLVYAQIASNQKNQKLFYKALQYYLQAEKNLNKNNTIDYVSWLNNTGECYLYIGETEIGMKLIREAKQLAGKHKMFTKLENIYDILKNYYLRQNDYKKAYFYNDSSSAFADSVNIIEQQNKIAELNTKYQTEKKERENLLLKNEVRQKELENQHQRRMKLIFIASTLIFLVLVLVIGSLFRRLRIKNIELLNRKKELELLNTNLKKSKDETERALEFKSLFLANMSHEIRTPLNIIIGFNSILKKKISDVKLLKYLESIEMSSYNLLRFLNDILDMSKIEAGKIMLNPDTINLRLLIMNIKELFMLKAREKNLDFPVEIDPKMPQEIIIDEIRLRQILVNLIGNAIKFTQSGYVKVIADAPVLNKYQSGFSTKINLRIRVIDSGIGISEEDVKQIFESFRQVNLKEQKEMGGSGLGLAISKRLTEMMNGEIFVESTKGEGSVFTVLFRDIAIGINPSGKPEKRASLHEELEYDFSGGSILVADDEEMNRSLIRVCFEHTKVEIFEAGNGKETIELARKHKPDIIMMDIKMPEVDGLEASRILRQDEDLKHIPIIAFSASNIFDRLDKEEIDMFSGLISKPVLLEDLYEKASKYLPHQIKEKKEIMSTPDDFTINTFKDDGLAAVIETDGEPFRKMKQKWSKIYSTNSMNKILEFTNEMEDFAVKINLEGLKMYAGTIREAGQNFEIDKVKKLLKLFPELFQTVKS